MSAAERRAALDATLASIDSTLADYKADRREAWIEENLNHPGQMHVAIAGSSWFERWEEGEISDEQAQAYADDVTATVEARAAREFFHRVVCWYCGGWARPGCQMHGYCRREWAAAKRGSVRHATTSIEDPYSRGWTRCLRSDGTGYGGEWDEENGRSLPPSVLVDGVGITVGPHVFCLAHLK